jgi:hypothetical protein
VHEIPAAVCQNRTPKPNRPTFTLARDPACRLVRSGGEGTPQSVHFLHFHALWGFWEESQERESGRVVIGASCPTSNIEPHDAPSSFPGLGNNAW